MSDNTKIEWSDATLNVVTGCTKVSKGCDNCYAETFAERWRGTPGHYFENGFDVQLRPDKLDLPLRWKKPRRIFVNSMSDLFHDSVPDEFIAQVFDIMGAASQHTFQILTKRHARMRSLLQRWTSGITEYRRPDGILDCYSDPPVDRTFGTWPLPNVWLGVSVENQQWADIRIPALLDTPAAMRFLSCEPLLGPVDLAKSAPAAPYWHDRIDWVITGGESGHGARPMHPSWARSLRDQCQAAGVAHLFKQWGAWCPPHPDQGQSIYGHVTNDEACQVVTEAGELRGRPWGGWGLNLPSAVVMRRYGKSDAGRLLDGRTWDEFPTAPALTEAAS